MQNVILAAKARRDELLRKQQEKDLENGTNLEVDLQNNSLVGSSIHLCIFQAVGAPVRALAMN